MQAGIKLHEAQPAHSRLGLGSLAAHRALFRHLGGKAGPPAQGSSRPSSPSMAFIGSLMGSWRPGICFFFFFFFLF